MSQFQLLIREKQRRLAYTLHFKFDSGKRVMVRIASNMDVFAKF